MPQPPLLRRAVAWADRLLHAGPRAAAPCPAAPAAVPPATAAAADPPSAPFDPQHREGLDQAAAHRWSWAQRALECAARAAPDGPAAADLASVRAVRWT